MTETRQHNHILLTQSGHLTRMACRHYSNNKLTGEFLFVVEEHLRSCEMCSDAVEGMGMISPRKSNDDDQFQENLAALEKRLDTHAAGFKASQKNKQRRLVYISGVAASIVIILTVLVTVRYDQFQNIELFAENTVEEVPIDRINIELAAYEGRFHAPVQDQSDRSEASFAGTGRSKRQNQSESRNVTNKPDDKPKELDNNVSRQAEQEEEISEMSPDQEQEDVKAVTDADTAISNVQNDVETQLQRADRTENVDDHETSGTTNNTLPAFAGSPGTEKFKQYLEAEYYRQETGGEGIRSLAGIKISGNINKKGKLGKITIENAADAEQEQLLNRIISNALRWTPAEQDGEQVKSNIEVRFTGEQQSDSLSH